ncbi:Acyl-coenzyme A synthetase/AMP-(fatty) acid ligase [Filomicrobium insigne]|uniref:Acyl-coenzyme A synthetase/AMP-(Fatty) acid ligase n=1 Tax=Filomicrobium insigne TaxID=418854 RepID=A0A1H0TB04_9HYPH|nr:Acyl-coenzyme A synthetase/AMP-(fatty) acid ligase [Filomicrobium insigne]
MRRPRRLKHPITNKTQSSHLGFSGQPPPKALNLAAYCLAPASQRPPDKPALIVIEDVSAKTPAEVWTYGELDEAVRRVAAGLSARGLPRGSRIVLSLGNTSAFPLAFFGAIAAGFVPIPTSAALTPSELAFIVADSEAELVICDDEQAASALPSNVALYGRSELHHLIDFPESSDYVATHSDDPAYLIYTSGTTASPKGVIHAHRAAWGRRPMYQGWYGITPEDRVLHAGAFNWTFTLGTGLTDPWANGATAIIFTGEKNPAVWPNLIEKTEASIFAAVPGLIRQILKYADVDPTRMPTLRHALIAGEAPPPDLFEEWTERTGRQLYEALGMSEISTYISSSPTVPRKSGTVGRAQPGRSIAILSEEAGNEPLAPGEPGLIAIHRTDPGLMLGYWKRPDEEAAVIRGDWFVGGDLGVMDSEGYISHLGRADDVIKALGYRIAPQEVEAVLVQHPHVAECACAALEVSSGVTILCAFIVAQNSGSPPRQDDLLAFAASRLAAYKCPREIRFIDKLPRTANGKIKRSILSKEEPMENLETR